MPEQPFPNGDAYMYWTQINCDGCTKWHPDPEDPQDCEIEFEIMQGGVQNDEVLRRMGYFERDKYPSFAWPCPERDPSFDQNGIPLKAGD